MKNIVKFTSIKPQGRVTIDAFNPDLQYGLEELLDQYIPYSRIFEYITIKNFTTIPEQLLNRLTNQYLHGAQIEFTTPSRKFSKVYVVRNARPFFSYKWEPLDLSKPIPKSLAQFEFKFNGKMTTYLNAIKTLTSTRYLPNDIWVALDEYSKQQIDKCREYNKGEYSFAEDWFKELMKDCMQSNVKVFSPNKKTYYEAIAELDFERDCASAQLADGLRPLTEDELLFLKRYASAYGVEVPTFQWKINSRKTDHGYTQEPERIVGGMSNTDWSRVIWDGRNAHKGNMLPKFVRQGLTVREYDNAKLLRDAYFQLQWIIKHLKDNGLMPGYKRCPKCHEIYKESDGCECGYCKPIKFVDADNLFYGVSSTYEDYESTASAYEDDSIQIELEDEDLD